jgi:hypothetical protein
MATLTITVKPTDQHGLFEAALDGKLICKSRTPFCTAARVLLERGYPPGAIIVLRHVGSDTDSLRATIAAAAKLTVQDDDRGTPRFRPWKPFSRAAVTPPVRSNDEIAHVTGAPS